MFLDQNNRDSNSASFNQKLESGVDWISYIGNGSGLHSRHLIASMTLTI